MPKIATVTITGKSPLSFSRYYSLEEPKNPRESHDDYEKRTWRKRMHTDVDGNVIIPPMAFKNMLEAVASRLSEKMKGKQTFGPRFRSGIMCTEPMPVGCKADEALALWLHVPSDGKKGGKSRVMKCFPKIDKWGGTVSIHVLDDMINEDVFIRHMKEAGDFVGLGSFRPANGGYFGRFDVNDVAWAAN